MSKRLYIVLTIISAVILMTGCAWEKDKVKTPDEIAGELESLSQNTSQDKKEKVEEKTDTTDKKETEVQKKTSTRLIFTGDIMPYGCVLNNYDRNGLDGIVSDRYQKLLKNADITMVNEEFPFSTRGTPAPDKQFTFRISPSYVSILTGLGTDLVTLANNHTLDYGGDALRDTVKTLNRADISYTGAGTTEKRAKKLIIKKRNGMSFGFLAASRVIPVSSWDVRYQKPGVFTTYDPSDLLTEIKAAKKKCDYLTVYVHWGIERAKRPEEYQRTMARQYIDAGADIVIGSHPHVLQGFEYYKGKPIIYSLGNFIFNTTIDSTVALELTVGEDQNARVKLIPGYASDAKTMAVGREKAEKIFKELEKISYGVKISKDGVLRKE